MVSQYLNPSLFSLTKLISSSNTGKTGDVERSPTPTPPLVLGLWAKSWSWKSWFPFQWTSFSCLTSSEYEWVRREITGRVTGSRSELILYFKSKFQTWVGKLRGDSASRVLFSTGLRHLSRLRSAQLKLFSSGGTFRYSWVPQPIWSASINESREFVYDRTPRHKCKTPSSGTACSFHFLSHHRIIHGKF